MGFEAFATNHHQPTYLPDCTIMRLQRVSFLPEIEVPTFNGSTTEQKKVGTTVSENLCAWTIVQSYLREVDFESSFSHATLKPAPKK